MDLGLNALGIVTNLGTGKRAVAGSLFRGDRGHLRPCNDMIVDKTVYAGAVDGRLPDLPSELAAFDCRNNRLILAAILEIEEEIGDAIRRFGAHRIAVVLGTSTSGIGATEIAYDAYRKQGAWPADFDYWQHEAGGLPEFVTRYLGLSGPSFAVATACSSSAKVFASARRLIAAGLCDAAIVGGADSLCRMTLNGFDSLEAMSSGLCNPFSVNRDGINIGEGAAVFLMTPDPGPVGVAGIGESSDAHHISAPDPEGTGAIMAMKAALDDAGISGDSIAYVNLHGTGTPLNDSMESIAVSSLFPAQTPCSSTKAMTGHMLGAAGAGEAAFLWLTLNPEFNPGTLPPHLWDGAADPELPRVNLVEPGTSFQSEEGTALLSSSFAFGGNNVALVLARQERGCRT